MSAEASDIGRFHGEAARDLLLDRRIECFGIRSLDLAVETPGNCEVIQRSGVGETQIRRYGPVVNWRKRIPISEAGRGGTFGGPFDGICAGRIRYRGVQAVGTILVERIDQGLAVVVVVDSRTDANRSLAIG